MLCIILHNIFFRLKLTAPLPPAPIFSHLSKSILRNALLIFIIFEKPVTSNTLYTIVETSGRYNVFYKESDIK